MASKRKHTPAGAKNDLLTALRSWAFHARLGALAPDFTADGWPEELYDVAEDAAAIAAEFEPGVPTPAAGLWEMCEQWLASHPGQELPHDLRETRWVQPVMFVPVEAPPVVVV